MFKITETKKVIPAEEEYEVAVKTYVCEAPGCSFKIGEEDYGFSDDPEQMMKGHYGREHSVKKKMEVCKVTFYWFDSKEDAEAYQRYQNGDDEFALGACRRDTYFESPGWYTYHSYEEVGRCRCGKCHDYFEDLRSAAWWFENQRKEIASLNSQRTKLKVEVEIIDQRITVAAEELNLPDQDH